LVMMTWPSLFEHPASSNASLARAGPPSRNHRDRCNGRNV
jgi:hypothetical protein